MKKLLVVIAMLFLVTGCSKNEEVPYPGIRYQEVREDENELHTVWACIRFLDNGKYSLYDCDSEPTSYAFDNEWECTYKYQNNKMRFNCKYGDGAVIKITKWDEETFEFIYDGETKTFKSEDWIKENLEEDF